MGTRLAGRYSSRYRPAGVAIGGRYTRAVTLDRQARRQLCGIAGIIDEVGQFVGEPRGLVLLDARHQLLAGIKPQPGIQQVPLLDRFDDRRVGAFEFQGCNPFSMQSRTIGSRGKFLMKTPDCVKTPLMAAFRAARTDRRKPRGKTIPHALALFASWRIL